MAEIELDNIDELQEQQEAVPQTDETPQSPLSPEDQGEQESPEAPDGTDVQDGPEEPAAAGKAEPVGSKLMRSLVSDDDETDELTVDTLRQMIDAAPRWFLSQWRMLLLCLAGIFLYITNGYQAQMEMMQETELEAELKDWRYRCITRVSELTLLCRQSQLEQKLREQGDSTLVPSKVAPYVINVRK
ncbi:MAG: hypothetical protein IJ615_07990 [Bacteroidaceae bacterium]|nr:hypothetical protein [Bacteroidaceae bacterium]